jgi:cold-inducible RNA-binding protein
MRPAHKTVSAGVWIVREQACYKLRSRSFRASEFRSFDCYRSPKPFRFVSFFSFPKKGKGISMSTKLYVGNLAFQTTSQELQELFASAGTVESAAVVEDRDTGRSRGFGFVEMSTKEEGAAAISQFNGKEVNGRALNVNEAKPRENRSGGGGGRGFGGGGGRGGFGGGGNGGGGGYGQKREPRW